MMIMSACACACVCVCVCVCACACVCVCVCVCSSVRVSDCQFASIAPEQPVQSLPVLSMLPTTVTRSSSGSVAKRYKVVFAHSGQ